MPGTCRSMICVQPLPVGKRNLQQRTLQRTNGAEKERRLDSAQPSRAVRMMRGTGGGVARDVPSVHGGGAVDGGEVEGLRFVKHDSWARRKEM